MVSSSVPLVAAVTLMRVPFGNEPRKRETVVFELSRQTMSSWQTFSFIVSPTSMVSR